MLESLFIAQSLLLALLAALVLKNRNRLVELDASFAMFRRDVLDSVPLGTQPDYSDDMSLPEAWPDDAPLQPGTHLPKALAAHLDPRWGVCLFAEDDVSLESLLADIPEPTCETLFDRYAVYGFLKSGGSGTHLRKEISVAPLAAAFADRISLPAALMVDPSGAIRGAAEVRDGGSVLAFIFEGEHLGYGPDHEYVRHP